MSEAVKKLGIEAAKLLPQERMELVDEILASLDRPDERLDRLWAKEAEDRLAAYRRGEIKAVDFPMVLSIRSEKAKY
jgi:putative addiction module component (TIGR02574 family)